MVYLEKACLITTPNTLVLTQILLTCCKRQKAKKYRSGMVTGSAQLSNDNLCSSRRFCFCSCLVHWVDMLRSGMNLFLVGEILMTCFYTDSYAYMRFLTSHTLYPPSPALHDVHGPPRTFYLDHTLTFIA